jgi:DNA-binding CsgD family transcriptional regulator
MGSGASGRGQRGEELLALAGAALGRGDWAGARDAYRQVLEGGESAAVLEGLAYACWWLQEDATTVDCRRRAFRLYLDADDQVSAARVAISLARDHILRGEHSVANGWVGRARRLLAEAGPVAEAGWLGIVRAHIALYADRDPPQARRLAAEAVAVGRAVGSRDVEMQALAYEGLGLVSEGLIAEGMRKLDESGTAAISGELSGVDEAGTIACCLIAACERVRDIGRAAEWCERLKELCQGWSFELMIAVCRTHYGSTLVSRGRWREAEREFHAAIAGFGHPHRGQAAEAHVRLADLRVRQGRLGEAAELVDTVSSGPGRMLGHKLALAAQGAVAHAFGDPTAARVALLDAADLFAEVDAPYERAQATLLLARCLAGSGRREAAAARAAEALQLAQALGARTLIGAARDLLAELGASAPTEAVSFAGLTRRETEILRLLARGEGNHDIAARLVISVRTVERHVSNIYLKLGVEGNGARTSAVAAALQHGLV